MATLIPAQTVLTPSGAANDLQTHGLDALGLTVPNLSPVWAANPPAKPRSISRTVNKDSDLMNTSSENHP